MNGVEAMLLDKNAVSKAKFINLNLKLMLSDVVQIKLDGLQMNLNYLQINLNYLQAIMVYLHTDLDLLLTILY